MLEYELEIGAEVSQIIWVRTQISCLSTYSNIWWRWLEAEIVNLSIFSELRLSFVLNYVWYDSSKGKQLVRYWHVHALYRFTLVSNQNFFICRSHMLHNTIPFLYNVNLFLEVSRNRTFVLILPICIKFCLIQYKCWNAVRFLTGFNNSRGISISGPMSNATWFS